MGAGSSIPKKMPKLADYKGKVLPTQVIVNNIFQFMMSEVEIQDLLRLANPRYCRDYVFITKEALSKYFDEIQIEPKLGSKDVLYFQSVKRLTFSDDKQEKDAPIQKQYRDMLCKQLAFFYVRIFQVFGALALTVIDSLPETAAKPADLRGYIEQEKIRRAPLIPQYGGGARKVSQEDGYTLGAFYTYAKDFLYQLDTPGSYAISSTSLSGKTLRPSIDTGYIFFTPGSRPNLVYRPNAKMVVEAQISIEQPTDMAYQLQIQNIDINDVSYPRSFTFQFTRKKTAFTYEGRNFYSVLSAILSQIARSEIQKENVFGRKVGPQVPHGPTENVGVPTGMSYSYLIKHLQEKPKAYCVARAIQLLSPTLVDQVRKETPFTSDVCFYQAIPGLQDITPQVGQSLPQGSPGIRALQQLFYDFLDGNTPKIGAETLPKYREFVKMMQTLFNPDVPKEYATDLREVRAAPFKQCEDPTVRDKEFLLTNQNAIREVQKHVADLLDFQVKHTAEVMLFLKKMFRLDGTGKIVELQPALVKGGLPAVNAFADQARQILINYYRFCEGTYRLGALEVLAAPGKTIQPRGKMM